MPVKTIAKPRSYIYVYCLAVTVHKPPGGGRTDRQRTLSSRIALLRVQNDKDRVRYGILYGILLVHICIWYTTVLVLPLWNQAYTFREIVISLITNQYTSSHNQND